MPEIRVQVTEALSKELQSYLQHRQVSIDEVFCEALTQFLHQGDDTLFQSSTSAALVKGVYRGAMTLAALRQHGDLGLGTFDGLNGEMIVLDGEFFQATSDGSVRKVEDSATTPFAVVTQFKASRVINANVVSFEDLQQQLDRLRESENLFYSFRISGLFDLVHVRVVCQSQDGVPLLEAASHQSEFQFKSIEGTLVGFWSPKYANTFNIPGYHLHFISTQHEKAGHLFECSGKNLKIEFQHETHFSVDLPPSDEFLTADLTGDPTPDYAAEGKGASKKGDVRQS